VSSGSILYFQNEDVNLLMLAEPGTGLLRHKYFLFPVLFDVNTNNFRNCLLIDIFRLAIF
jgi:hypothetical protein